METTTLQWLLRAYRAMVPVKTIMEHMHKECGNTWTSLDFQQQVMNAVVNDKVCDKYPPHKTYIYRFLKSYMDAIERAMEEPCDDLMNAFVEYVVFAPQNLDAMRPDDMHHVSFSLPDHSVVTCRVASVFNDVGLKMWEAGWFLAEYILAFPAQFHNRTVLELGAGVGFTGLVLAMLPEPPNRVILSDYAPNVMQNLRYNVELNASQLTSPVDVLAIDWETWQPNEHNHDPVPDILLAGDCVYDVQAFPCLMRVLRVFLHGGTSSSSSSSAKTQHVAIFAATIRNQKTFQAFLDQVAQHGISYEDMTTEAVERMATPLFDYDNRASIRLCKLYLTAA